MSLNDLSSHGHVYLKVSNYSSAEYNELWITRVWSVLTHRRCLPLPEIRRRLLDGEENCPVCIDHLQFLERWLSNCSLESNKRLLLLNRMNGLFEGNNRELRNNMNIQGRGRRPLLFSPRSPNHELGTWTVEELCDLLDGLTEACRGRIEGGLFRGRIMIEPF